MLSMDKHTKPTRKPSNSSLETALLVRENAAETRRQMADLLDWEKSIKNKDSTASLASTTAASVPVRGKSSPVPNANAKERIKSGDYRAWDKFDVEEEISRMDAQEESSNSTPVQDQTIRESPQQIEERLEQSLIQKEMGNEYFKKGNYLKAIKSYSKSLEMCGSDASSNASKIAVLGNRAMAHLKLNQFEQAESDCTAVLSLDSKNVKAYWRRAVARRELQTNLSGAKQDLEKAKVLEPTNASVKQELEKLQKILEQAKKPLRRRVDITEVGDPKAYSTTSDLKKTVSPKAVESRVTERMDIQMKTAPSVPKPNIESIEPSPKVISAEIKNVQQSNASIPLTNSKNSNLKITNVENDAPASKQDKIAEPSMNQPSKVTPLADDGLNIASTKRPIITPLISEIEPTKPIASAADVPLNAKPTESANLQKAEPAATKAPIQEAAVKSPKTMFEFEMEWKVRKSDSKALYALIKSMNPSFYRTVFKNSMESHYLSAFVHVMKEFYIHHETAQLLFETLEGLSRVERFNMNVKFLGSKDKSAVKELFSDLRSRKGELESNEVDLDQLETKYGLRK
ncbi:hypothetical protein CcCBS67573_g00708 [Chytriomyces confervae]|uniref:RNA polymerase II-associated protein 3 n=1 Tax=Chytriomyces confervae TaxID=246404 RepID=A0A507FQQ1_9FUNG|nr:hypothetical protein HDU80_004701 [Chytriomyces hyalinus]TPX78030.1 hypothetical protein CcCBS67573_g00708 [Chytriomyces confervae]